MIVGVSHGVILDSHSENLKEDSVRIWSVNHADLQAKSLAELIAVRVSIGLVSL